MRKKRKTTPLFSSLSHPILLLLLFFLPSTVPHERTIDTSKCLERMFGKIKSNHRRLP
jgi:hypothetical protein